MSFPFAMVDTLRFVRPLDGAAVHDDSRPRCFGYPTYAPFYSMMRIKIQNIFLKNTPHGRTRLSFLQHL